MISPDGWGASLLHAAIRPAVRHRPEPRPMHLGLGATLGGWWWRHKSRDRLDGLALVLAALATALGASATDNATHCRSVPPLHGDAGVSSRSSGHPPAPGVRRPIHAAPGAPSRRSKLAAWPSSVGVELRSLFTATDALRSAVDQVIAALQADPRRRADAGQLGFPSGDHLEKDCWSTNATITATVA